MLSPIQYGYANDLFPIFPNVLESNSVSKVGYYNTGCPISGLECSMLEHFACLKYPVVVLTIETKQNTG